MALPKDACDTVFGQSGYEQSVRNFAQLTLQNDKVFGNDDAAIQLGTASGDVHSGYPVSLAVRVDTRTAPSGAQMPGGPGGPGGSGRPGGPPPSGS